LSVEIPDVAVDGSQVRESDDGVRRSQGSRRPSEGRGGLLQGGDRPEPSLPICVIVYTEAPEVFANQGAYCDARIASFGREILMLPRRCPDDDSLGSFSSHEKKPPTLVRGVELA
jgi:hypothetical protein